MLRRMVRAWRQHRADAALPAAARRQATVDAQGLPDSTPALSEAIDAMASWLAEAQDRSTTQDGGVAHSYSLIDGWQSSYPETTGYIVPTMLDYARSAGKPAVRDRARRMLDWLSTIQLPNGAFQGGKIDSTPVAPVVFNTGQILQGLAAGVNEFGAYRENLRRAADWLTSVQDPDGAWRQGASPFAKEGDKVYDTHTAWGLLEAARLEPGRNYGQAALANVDWALTYQQDNGWFASCCLTDPVRPLTHTLGYALRGTIEAYLYGGQQRHLEAALRAARGMRSALRADGFLPGRLRADWSGAVEWACLTGSVQIAHCWLLLYQQTGDKAWRDAGYLANAYVRRTIALDGSADIRGAVRGSFPVDGEYMRYAYPNWAAKFCIDSLLVESGLRQRESVTEDAADSRTIIR